MTKEEFNSLKNTVDSDQQSIYLYKAYVLSLEEEVEKLKQQKRCLNLDKTIMIDRWLGQKHKARSIVAMLFWNWKKAKKEYSYANEYYDCCELGKMNQAKDMFDKAYAMLKATK